MLRSLLAASIFLAASASTPALALDKFAWREVQRQVAQFQAERMYFMQMTVEQQRRMNERAATNQDRPLRGAKMIAGGPPKIISVKKAIRLEPIKWKRKGRVGGIVGHIGSASAGSSNFGRILSNGPAGSVNFRALGEGAAPFSLTR